MAKGYGRPPMGRKGGKGMGMGMPGLNMDMIKRPKKCRQIWSEPRRSSRRRNTPPRQGGGVVSATVDGKHTLKGIDHRPRGSGPGGCGNAPGYGDCCGQ